MPLMRVGDLIARLLVEHGVTDVFMLTGGGAMHLNDALGRTPGLRAIFTHHEQAAAIAAESYGRLSGRLAAVNVTTGPGGVNALNGVYGAYVDSIGMIVISGQVKRETYAPNYALPLRQLGDQEIDIVSMVRGITKYAVVLQDPNEARRVIEKALWLAMRGRPGPVWIDVPIDVQGAMVDPDLLPAYDPRFDNDHGDEAANTAAETGALTGAALDAQVSAMLGELMAAKRPLVLAGAGVRLSGQHAEFLAFIERVGVPVVSGWNAHDVIANDHPLYIGRPGTVGDRGGNFAVQTADYLLVLGSRLNIRQVSYNWAAFAKDARIAMVDIDRAELAKPTLSLHRPIHADLRDVFAAAARLIPLHDPEAKARAGFVEWSRMRAAAYPVVEPDYWSVESPINPYCFGEALFDALDEGDIVVTGDGTACVTIFQAARIKSGQRLYTNSGCASMGYDLPAAIGACYASGGKRIVCLAGDGSIMMNLQELQTIVGQKLPITIFVLNNDGYHSIRQTQQNYFPDNIVGCGPDSGLTFPDFHRLAAGFALPASRVDSHAALPAAIREALNADGPHLCEVMIDKAQAFAPKLASRRLADGTMVSPSLEDMAPFLSREDLCGGDAAARRGGMIDHIVFDLDGTLIDSAPLCVDILNMMARKRGSAVPVDEALARRYLSRGGTAMIAAVLGDLAGDAETAIAEFRRHYVQRATPPESLYAGVFGGLIMLREHGFRLAICSNKPQHLCEKVVADLGMDAMFDAVVGSQAGLRRKPDPQPLHHTLALLGARPDQCLYVGDSDIDHATATAAGTAFCWVTYGYADPDWNPVDCARQDNFDDLTGAIIALACAGVEGVPSVWR